MTKENIEKTVFEDPKEFVHPLREKANDQIKLLVEIINMANEFGWSSKEIVGAITLTAKIVVHTTNQLFSDVEKLQRQINSWKYISPN